MEIISVLEVVESIATQVPAPTERPAGILDRNDVPASALRHKFEKLHFPVSAYRMRMNFLNGLFLSAYRDSQSAGALDFYLDQAKEGGPKWYDCGPTGWPKESSSAREEGLSMLVHMARYFERYMQAYQSGRFDGWPKRNEMKANEGKFATQTDSQRLSEIGFERAELVRFLRQYEIPSNLTTDSRNLAERSSAMGNTPFPSAVETEVDLGNTTENIDKDLTTPGSSTHLINKSRHVLADFIAAAQAQAGDQRKNARVVYGILIKMADSGDFSPLVTKFIPREGIEYLSGTVYKPYTYGALDKYINPEKRGHKKKPPSEIDDAQLTSVNP